MFNPGQLRETITIYKLSGNTRDEYGESVENYVPYITLRARVKFNGGNKTIENFETYNTKSITFETYNRKIDDTMRIHWKDDVYIINSMPVIEYDYISISTEKLKNK